MSAEVPLKGLRVLMVLEAGDFYPSGFIRGLIYREHLERAGFQATFVSRLLEPFMRIAAAPSRLMRVLLRLPMAARLLGWLERRATERNEAAIARAAATVDVVYLSKVTSLPFVKRLRAAGARRIVLDFGDAIWLPRYPVQGVDELISSVDAVTTDNELTAQYIRERNPRCTVVPDSPQVEWFERRRAAVPSLEDGGALVLGWIGSRSTTYNLFVAWEALERIFARHPNVHLRLLGADPRLLPPFERVRYSLLETYSQEQMVDEALRMHVGLFPLQDVEACRVRGVLKATVYMSAGAAAVTSRVGQCNDLIKDGVNGMLAGSTVEWEEKLERLIADAATRRRIAEAGLAHVRAQFTVDRSFALLRPVLEGP